MKVKVWRRKRIVAGRRRVSIGKLRTVQKKGAMRERGDSNQAKGSGSYLGETGKNLGKLGDNQQADSNGSIFGEK